jgi:methionyl-tRNA formyltransferase
VTEDGLLGPTPPPLASDGPDDLDILLLMKPPEAAFCAAALAKHDPALRIARAGDLEILRAGAARAGRRGRLIGFSTAIVVPGALLPAFAGGAYNFHPGPPEFPGNRPSAFACHAEAPTFGVTFHRMEAKVDSGEILDCERFSTAGLRTASELAIKAYQHLARLFLRNTVALASLDTPLTPIDETWSGRKTTLADFEAMRAVPGDIAPAELDLRVRAFNWVYTPL